MKEVVTRNGNLIDKIIFSDFEDFVKVEGDVDLKEEGDYAIHIRDAVQNVPDEIELENNNLRYFDLIFYYSQGWEINENIIDLMATECMYNQIYADHLMSLINNGKTDNEPLYKAIMAIFNLTVKLLEELHDMVSRNWEFYKQQQNSTEESAATDSSSDTVEVEQEVQTANTSNKNGRVYSEEAILKALHQGYTALSEENSTFYSESDI